MRKALGMAFIGFLLCSAAQAEYYATLPENVGQISVFYSNGSQCLTKAFSSKEHYDHTAQSIKLKIIVTEPDPDHGERPKMKSISLAYVNDTILTVNCAADF